MMKFPALNSDEGLKIFVHLFFFFFDTGFYQPLKNIYISLMTGYEIAKVDKKREYPGKTTYHNDLKYCFKWKIYYFSVSQNLGTLQPNYNVLKYRDT